MMKRFTDLHEFIVLHILCFLPAKFIIRCRCVCKDWANLICQPCFPQEYLSRARIPLQLLLEKNNDIVLAQFDESLLPDKFLIPIKTTFDLNIRRFFDLPSPGRLQIFTCQVTGWILAIVDPWKSICRGEQLYDAHMYNPITGQHIVVRDHKKWENCALVSAGKTNELKLLIFHRKSTSRTYSEAAIQTIGTNLWRSIGEVYECQGMPVLLNGLWHWLNDRAKLIISFDADVEVFELIYTPSCFQNCKWFNLGSLDGCLCLTLITSSRDTELWVMQKYGIRDSWTKISVSSSFGKRPITYVWKKDSTIKVLKAVTLLRSGELLVLVGTTTRIENVWKKYSNVIGYNPHTRKYRYVGFTVLHNYLDYNVYTLR